MTNTRKMLGIVVLLVIIGFLFYLFFSEKDGNRITTLKVEKLEVGEEIVREQKVEKQEVKESRVEEQNVRTQCVETQCAQVQPQNSTTCVACSPVVTPSCQNECSFNGQRRCAPDCIFQNQYQICGNYDSDYCLEWSTRLICPSGQICQNGQCVSRCTSYYSKVCYQNKVYWYDSCGNKEGTYQECGQDFWTDNYRCQGNWVQREKRKRGCSDSNCYDYSQWENHEYCGILGQVCQLGRCVPTCTNECSYTGERRCINYIGYLVCGEFDNDFCLDWSSPQLCSPNYTCENSVCVASEPSYQSPPPPVTPPSSSCPTCQPGPNPP